MISDSNDETNFSNKYFLTNWQVLKLHKAFANNSTSNMKLSNTQLSKMVLSVGIFGRLFERLIKNWVTINKNCT